MTSSGPAQGRAGLRVGILGGTGTAGRGLGTRLAAAGMPVTLGSRDGSHAVAVASDVVARWPGRQLSLSGADNSSAAESEVVVIATPWDAAVLTVRQVRQQLKGKAVISMVNALTKVGREIVAIHPPRGSVGAEIQAVVPECMVAVAFNHLSASQMEDLDSVLEADVLVCSDHREALEATIALARSIPKLRPLEAGSLSQADAIETFTGVFATLNILHRARSSVRITGI